MPETQVEVDDMLEGPVHRLFHGGRSDQAADLFEQVVVDVDEPFGHTLNISKYEAIGYTTNCAVPASLAMPRLEAVALPVGGGGCRAATGRPRHGPG